MLQRLKHWIRHIIVAIKQASVGEFVPLMWQWLLASLVLLAIIWLNQPQQLPVIVYKAAQFCASVYIAHMLDRSFWKSTPGEPRDTVTAAKEIARALVFIGTVMGLTLGI